MKLSIDSSSISAMQLGLQFATQYFQLSIAHSSVSPDLSSIQFCIWTFLSWFTHQHWTSDVWRMCGGQEAELLHSDKRSVTEWQRAKVEKEHLNSKWQESPSKQKTPNPLLTIWEMNHTGCELLCWCWDSHCISLYLPYYKPATTDTQAGPEGHSLMKLPIC